MDKKLRKRKVEDPIEDVKQSGRPSKELTIIKLNITCKDISNNGNCVNDEFQRFNGRSYNCTKCKKKHVALSRRFIEEHKLLNTVEVPRKHSENSNEKKEKKRKIQSEIINASPEIDSPNSSNLNTQPMTLLEDFIKNCLMKISSSILKNSLGRAKSSAKYLDGILKEFTWQLEFYRSACTLLPEHCYISGGVGAILDQLES